MCGVGPATAMLVASRILGATQADLVEYATSAEVSKDFNRVVGYAGVIVR
jgi:AmmeMemoRadiSam system protein B